MKTIALLASLFLAVTGLSQTIPPPATLSQATNGVAQGVYINPVTLNGYNSSVILPEILANGGGGGITPTNVLYATNSGSATTAAVATNAPNGTPLSSTIFNSYDGFNATNLDYSWMPWSYSFIGTNVEHSITNVQWNAGHTTWHEVDGGDTSSQQILFWQFLDASFIVDIVYTDGRSGTVPNTSGRYVSSGVNQASNYVANYFPGGYLPPPVGSVLPIDIAENFNAGVGGYPQIPTNWSGYGKFNFGGGFLSPSDQRSVSLSGTFTGNGGGLTNVWTKQILQWGGYVTTGSGAGTKYCQIGQMAYVNSLQTSSSVVPSPLPSYGYLSNLVLSAAMPISAVSNVVACVQTNYLGNSTVDSGLLVTLSFSQTTNSGGLSMSLQSALVSNIRLTFANAFPAITFIGGTVEWWHQ